VNYLVLAQDRIHCLNSVKGTETWHAEPKSLSVLLNVVRLLKQQSPRRNIFYIHISTYVIKLTKRKA
jgi:hypothetical protein